MPHLTVEHSGNLDRRVDMARFCAVLRDEVLATGLFELGAVRVRALRCEAFAVADALAANAFIDMTLRVGAGRSESEKKAAGDRIFEAASEFLTDLVAEPHFALSMEIREIDPGLSWKQNTMHARLRDGSRT